MIKVVASQLKQFETVILQEQKVEVDAVSGATVSCNGISDALKKVLVVK
jgi:uncharacterized protein with FMN-binding domain